MQYNIPITPIAQSKVHDLDFNNIPLGTTFTDHMFICDYEEGKWINPRIEPLRPVATHPAAMALHYGQAIFEGMKASKTVDGVPMLMRPEDHAKRFNASAVRMCMPEIPEDLFVDLIKKLVSIDRAWIPPITGSSGFHSSWR